MIFSKRQFALSPDDIRSFVDRNYAGYGVNKRQQITRLLFEIAKREEVGFEQIVSSISGDVSFSDLKKKLMERRYPNLSDRERSGLIFPELKLDKVFEVDVQRPLDMAPKYFIIEESVRGSKLAQRLLNNYPEAKFEYIGRYRDYHKKIKFGVKEYNERLSTFFITREYYDLITRCPCSSKSVSCQLHIAHLGSGCAYECAYCYLPDYINYPGIVIPGNIEDFFSAFERQGKDMRIGSGELTDSLVFDHITGFSSEIVNFFRRFPGSTFEFKTKSANIENLLNVDGTENIVIAWSMNPQSVIDSAEFYTKSLEERLIAAKKCVDHGYRVAFHFDPLIYYKHWEGEYENLVNRIFDLIPAEKIETLSLGTLRMTAKHKKIIESRFVDNTILDEEFILGHDGKFRYPFGVRTKMYKKMKEWISARNRNVCLYLCMEEKDACMSCESAPLKQYSTTV